MEEMYTQKSTREQERTGTYLNVHANREENKTAQKKYCRVHDIIRRVQESTIEQREQNCSKVSVQWAEHKRTWENTRVCLYLPIIALHFLQNKGLRGSNCFLKTITKLYKNMATWSSPLFFFGVRKVEVKSYTPTLLLLSTLNFCQCFVISLSTFDEFLSKILETQC